MKRNNSFPHTLACFVRPALFGCALLLTSLSVCAPAAQAQTTAARPVARLITSSSRVPSASSRVGDFERGRIVVRVAPVAARSTAPVAAPTSLERRAFNLINVERRARGEAELVWDAELTRMARLHSERMAEQDFFNHTDPDGRDTVARAHDFGISGWHALAENIAYNAGDSDPAGFAVEHWLRSPKHRDNILRDGFTHSGLGVATAADGRVFFTQVFLTR